MKTICVMGENLMSLAVHLEIFPICFQRVPL